MIKRNYEMEIHINGRPVKEYFHNDKTYIEGRKDSIFSILLRNNSSERTLFVPTVDGLSTIDGKDGSFDSRGYILDAYSSMKIDGWRINDDEVAEFYFSCTNESYRKRLGKGKNIGSIAIAVFREKEKASYDWPNITIEEPNVPFEPWKPWRPIRPCDDPIYTPRIYSLNDNIGDNRLEASNCSAMYKSSVTSSKGQYSGASVMRKCEQDIGTGFGQTKRSEVISVSFDRENQPDTVIEVFYNSRKQLSRMGVDFNRRRHSISRPDSFPKQRGYCRRPNN